MLPIVPVDPRDLFRGEYVRARIPAAQVPLAPADGAPESAMRRSTSRWRSRRKVSGARSRCRALKREDNPSRIVLKGASAVRMHPSDGAAPATVRYGIESYFVRQGEGPKLEAMAREHKLAVLVAVEGGGTAAIKGLIVDGKLQYEEPLS